MIKNSLNYEIWLKLGFYKHNTFCFKTKVQEVDNEM